VGALSDDRTGLSFVKVIVYSNTSCHNVQDIYILHIIHANKCMYIQYIQDLCQSGLSTADYALFVVVSGKTAV
jgi:hypothetical protein